MKIKFPPTYLFVALVIAAASTAFAAPQASQVSLQSSPQTFPAVKDLPVHHEMPDVLTMLDGTKVTTPAQWQQRREEMKAILEFYELGHAPLPPGNVIGEELFSRTLTLSDGSTALYKLVRLKFGPEQKLDFEIAIYTPVKGGPFPTIINPSFFMTPGSALTLPLPPSQPATQTSSTTAPSAASKTSANAQMIANFRKPQTPEQGAENFAAQLARGYAVVTYRYTQCGEDNADFRSSSFYPAYPDCDWGVLRGWAWGLSRVVDYLETQSFADKTKLIALGHSRLGKLTMVAAAFDERISLGAPAGSSGAGTGAYRFCGPGRGGKEGIEDMTRKFPYYFVPRLKDFTGQMEKLPFEAYWFIALTAPRSWISIEGTDDQNCVPDAVRRSVLAAKPIYEFLGVSPDRVGINFESHRHALTPDDWKAVMDFADQQLLGIDHQRRFDLFPQTQASASPTTVTTTAQTSATTIAIYNVSDFGAIGDGATKDTAAFQKALDTCAVNGGGEVFVPAGKFLIGSVQMGNRTILRLHAESVIIGSGDINDYPLIDVRWEGRWQPGRRALIYSTNVDHTGILGPGRIEGNPDVAAPQNPRGAVVLEPISCNDVRWEDFTVTQGGNWATHPTYCTGVAIRNLKITGNRDGIDIDSCKDVSITKCDIDTGDDCISLKSGRGMDGARIGKPTENVSISQCTFNGRRFAAIGIGSETSGGIRNVRIDHCKMTARTFGVYIKTRVGRAGTIEDICCDELDILGGGFLKINLATAGNANTADDSVEGVIGIPQGRNFSFTNVRVTKCARLVEATSITPEKPLEGLILKNITGDCATGMTLANIVRADLENIQVTGCNGAFLEQKNVKQLSVRDIPDSDNAGVK